MATKSPSVAPNRANVKQQALMKRFGSVPDSKNWTLRKAYTPQLNLRLGMDRRHVRRIASFNNDFSTSFAIGDS